MKHITALIIKFIMVAVVLEIVLLSLTSLTFGEILFIALAVTVVAYLIGDLVILPLSNNTTATIADAILALLTIYMFNYAYYGRVITFTDCLISAIVLAVGEWFFHKYVWNKVITKKEQV